MRYGIPELFPEKTASSEEIIHCLNHTFPEEKFEANPVTGLLEEKEYIRVAEKLLSFIHVPWILISIDLEKFKLFNDWYGWQNGTKVLSSVGRTLDIEAKRAGGIAGYMGNDDFLLFAPEDKVKVKELYRSIHEIIGQYGVSGAFQPSFGISRVEKASEGLFIRTLIDQAALSCKNAQTDFRDRILYFDSHMVEETEKEYRFLSEFRRALRSRQITFYLQPQCRASNSSIIGAEALARWQKEDGSFLSPAVFVPMLEKTGFITDLDKYIWDSVGKWIHGWRERGGPFLPVSVNVSQIDIFTIDVPAFFKDLVKRYDIPINSIKIEITESALAENQEKVLSVVKELRDAGFLVMMDDFGSGYSSLNMLYKIDVDIIKIDAFFLHFEQEREEKGIHILESIINMTRTMGLPIIVEGVETKEQVEFLRTLGCRYMQGYYFYKPMPVRDFEALITKEDAVDFSGFTFKANEQFRVREFLDQTVYSDAMLNNILGPVAIYSWKGKDIDIIRFNEQFYQMVNVPDFQQRLIGIQQYMPEEDRQILTDTLEQAYKDHMNGATAVLTFFRGTGDSLRILMHFYYLRDKQGSRLYYGSARDVTQITLLQKNIEMITRQFSECLIFQIANDEGYHFEVVAQGIEELDLSKKELENELNSGIFYTRIVPEQQKMFKEQCLGALEGLDFSSYIALYNKKGERLSLYIESDCVEDSISNVACIIKISSP